MNCLALESHDPFFNLAVDEYFLKNSNEEFLILGINDPSVIIGKHQVAHREVDTSFIHANNIPVIRRISGGGTVFHDSGNINFSFIRQGEPGRQVDFRKNTLPVLEFLSSLGVNAKLEGKNDLKINGLKISGNAEHVQGNRVLHHGTLLFNASLEKMRRSLNRNPARYITRAVESNPSPVTNLKQHLEEYNGSYDLLEAMTEYFVSPGNDINIYSLKPEEADEINLLAASKYRTWEWNYAYGPEYQFLNMFVLNGKPCKCRLFVKEGIILECLIEGSKLMSEAGKRLTGARHMVEDMNKVFHTNNILLDYSDIYNFF